MATSLLMTLIFCSFLASNAAGLRLGLTRVHSDGGVTPTEFVRAAVRRDIHRFGRQLASADGSVAAQLRKDSPNGGEYVMTLAIGTPPVSYPAIADTGSDLIWTQCAPCSSQCFLQPAPMYNPSASSTFAALPCNSSLSFCAAPPSPPPPSCMCQYNQTYGSGWTAGIQSMETFTFGSAPADQVRVPNVSFGCSMASSGGWNGSAGLVGLGRGALSLVSQLGAGKFSYCLTPFSDANSTSTLLVGPAAVLNGSGAVRSTPFVASPAKPPMSTYYYLNLTGISVGAARLQIPSTAFSLRPDSTGGLFIDSGTTITWLVDAAYQPVRRAVQSLVTLPAIDGSATGLDLCFALPAGSPPPTMPDMTLHFDGADMALPVDNYMLSDSGVWCLAMGNRSDAAASTLGNYQQQDVHVLYDLANQKLAFAPAKCSTL